MSHMKRSRPSGVITSHTSLPVSLLKSEVWTADVESRKSLSQPSARTRSAGCVRPGKRNEASLSGSKQGPKQDWLSHTSLRQLKAKMEADNQQAKDIIQPILDTENGFMKELDFFLSQRDVTQLRRRELLHKRWTEHVWFPLQMRVQERASSCSPVEAKRRQSLYSHYLHHCNIKGFVFLETYDLREYNPFLNIKKPHYFKLKPANLKEQLSLHLHQRLKEERTTSCEAEHQSTWRKAEKLPQSGDHPVSESVTFQANRLPHNCAVTASKKIAVEHEARRKKSGRLDTIPYHIHATATSDGRCHQTSCWFSRCGSLQQSATSVVTDI